MPRVVELGEGDDDLHPFAVFPFLHDAADVATGDVGPDLLSTLVDVDGVSTVEEVLQGHIDVVRLADLDRMTTGGPHFLAGRGGTSASG